MLADPTPQRTQQLCSAVTARLADGGEPFAVVRVTAPYLGKVEAFRALVEYAESDRISRAAADNPREDRTPVSVSDSNALIRGATSLADGNNSRGRRWVSPCDRLPHTARAGNASVQPQAAAPYAAVVDGRPIAVPLLRSWPHRPPVEHRRLGTPLSARMSQTERQQAVPRTLSARDLGADSPSPASLSELASSLPIPVVEISRQNRLLAASRDRQEQELAALRSGRRPRDDRAVGAADSDTVLPSPRLSGPPALRGRLERTQHDIDTVARRAAYQMGAEHGKSLSVPIKTFTIGALGQAPAVARARTINAATKIV